MKITKQQIISYYDNCHIDYQLLWNLTGSLAMHYGFWDKTTKNLSQALEKENEVLAKKAKIKSTDLVLDAGCGVGGSSIYLAKKYGCKVVGITLSQKQVAKAKKNAQKYQVSHLVKFYKKDYLKTDYKPNTFDVVWAIESVCHAHNKKIFLDEAFRILKKGGRLIVADGFQTKKQFNKKEELIMEKWLNGWGVEKLEQKDQFIFFLNTIGFRKYTSNNINENIIPSSRRLYFASFPAYFLTKLGEIIKLRSRIQTANVQAAYYQYQALKKGLWEYLIFYAEK